MVDVQEEKGLARIAMNFAKLAGAQELAIGVSVFGEDAVASVNVTYIDGVKLSFSIREGELE